MDATIIPFYVNHAISILGGSFHLLRMGCHGFILQVVLAKPVIDNINDNYTQ